MLSALSQSPVLAVGFSFGFWIIGYILVYVLANEGLDWGRYFIFANLDFLLIREGGLFSYQTVRDSVLVLFVHFVLWMLTAYDGFVRREIRS